MALLEVNDTGGGRGKLSINFHLGQKAMWQSEKRFILVLAGAQSGKSESGPCWLWREIAKCGPGDYGVISPSYALMHKKVLPAFRMLFERILQLGKYTGSPIPVFKFNKAGMDAVFPSAGPMDSCNIFFGHAEDPDSLESSTFQAVWCFVAGTEITTSRGQVPIEKLRPDDRVLTRNGLRHIKRLFKSPPRQTYSVLYQDGRRIVGTGDHPIWVQGRGWVPLANLQCGDVCQSLERLSGLKESRSTAISTVIPRSPAASITKASGGTARLNCIPQFGCRTMDRYQRGMSLSTLMATTTTIASPTLRLRRKEMLSGLVLKRVPPEKRSGLTALGFTAIRGRGTNDANDITMDSGAVKTSYSRTRSGFSTMVLCPKGISYTTKMRTPEITTSQTLSRSFPEIMPGIISQTRDGNNLRRLCGGLTNLRANGIRPLKDEQSIANGERQFGRSGVPAPSHSPATIVKNRSRHSPDQRTSSTVREIAKPRPITGKRKAIVKSVTIAEIEPVYNLEVDTDHEYFANGVLVHNCDEVGQSRFKLASWEALQRRLSINEGRCLLTTTPYSFNWLYTTLYKPWEDAKGAHPTIDVVRYRSIDNPAFPQAEWDRLERELPKWKFDLMHRAIFTRPAGLIYEDFHEDDVIKPFPIPLSWPRHLGLDFGGINTAAIYYAENPDTHDLYAYREYHAGRRTAAQHVEMIKKGEPENFPASCCGGSKPEEQWREEFRAAGLYVSGPDITDVELGITRCAGLYKQRRVKVFDTLGGYLDELRSYSRVTDAAGNVGTEIENKESFHLCFVAGTPITTARGLVPIESLQFSDRVLTRHGYRGVARLLRTEVRPTYIVSYLDGRKIRGTADHPVWVVGEGFVPLSQLRPGDECLSLKYKSSMGSGIIGTRSRRTGAIGPISNGACDTCTERYGRSSTGLSPRACTCITKTRTPLTILLGILSLRHLSSMFNAILRRKGGKRHGNRCGMHMRSLVSGMVPRRASNSTRNTQSGSGSNGENRQQREFATIAERSIKNLTPNFIDSARLNVRQRLAGPQELTISTKPASGVGRFFGRTDTSNPTTVPIIVESVALAEPSEVFNLEVDGVHEYFANGVLVSNCDASRYILSKFASIRSSPFLIVARPPEVVASPKKVDTWAKLGAYSLTKKVVRR